MQKQLKIGNSKIYYDVLGNGNTVMLIHGFGEDRTVWDQQVEFLKNKFHLIVPDLPGSGKSEMVGDMSMEGLAEVIRQIIDTEFSNQSSGPGAVTGKTKARQICIIGHSMGGYIALAFAEKYPGYLNGFGLFHSSAYPDNNEKRAVRLKGIDFIKEHGAFEFLKTSIPNLFSPYTKEKNPELVKAQVAKASNFSDEALVSYYESMMLRPNREAVLEKAPFPVLFIMGEHDTAVPLNDSLKQCSLPEKSYIHLLQFSGHMGMSEEVDKSNHILEEYLNDNLSITSTLIE